MASLLRSATATHYHIDTAIGGGSTSFRYVPRVPQFLSTAGLYLRSEAVKIATIRMTQDANDKAAWLRFLLHRLLAALRDAKTPETAAVLRELIQETDNRLDKVEKR